ncbi:MAG: glycosyltransferase [Actinomycetaceae bacterium]|nr:glycosyltransferase [Actinomycetaceae bacterium]MDY6083618.1 glycosyltransferase [Actinomycetaceae bacterium]
MDHPQPMVTVIIPAYKVEGYIGRALESLLAQTFTDFEVIAVDDGSPDRSGEILDQYAKRDPRIRAVHQENGGAPAARNNAMSMARGKYYYFMDGDDWCEPTMLQRLVSLAEKSNAQMVVAGFYIDTYYGDSSEEGTGKFFRETKEVPSIEYASQDDFRHDAARLMDHNLLYAPWNKIILRSYVDEHHIQFRSTFMDDFPFNLDVIRDIERVRVTDEKFYHFIRARQESETTKYRPDIFEKREEEDGWLRELFTSWGVRDASTTEFLARRYTDRLIGSIENVTSPSSPLSDADKLADIERMACTPKARAAAHLAHANSPYMALAYRVIVAQNPRMMFGLGKLITKVKARTRLFAFLKSRR